MIITNITISFLIQFHNADLQNINLISFNVTNIAVAWAQASKHNFEDLLAIAVFNSGIHRVEYSFYI